MPLPTLFFPPVQEADTIGSNLNFKCPHANNKPRSCSISVGGLSC